MAQYYQILSQVDKPSMDELRQFYPNIVENQNIQYIISQEAPQALHAQEIIVSPSEKLILVDNSQQQIIVNQAQYQSQQYIIQQAASSNKVPVYYMEEEPLPKTIHHPVLLNQDSSSTCSSVVTTSTIKSPLVRAEQQDRIPVTRPTIMQPTRVVKSVVRKPQSKLSYQNPSFRDIQDMNEMDPEDNETDCEPISLPDGRVISIAEYKKILSEKGNKKGRNTNKGGTRAKGSRVTKAPERKPATNRSKAANKSGQYTPLMDSPQSPTIDQQRPQLLVQPRQSPYIISPHSHNQSPTQPVSLPPNIPTSQIQELIGKQQNSQLSEEFSDSIRMLVLLASGEQRLITFTLPKEQCTILEILEQIGIVIEADTKIECSETNINGINYIVTVGMSTPYGFASPAAEENESTESVSQSPCSPDEKVPVEKPAEPPKEEPRFVHGRLAVCMHCGYLSEDFNKCLRCKRKLPEDVKSIMSATHTTSKQSTVCKQTSAPASSNAAAKPVSMAQVGSTTPVHSSRNRSKPKVVEQEPIILTLSSDDEDENSGSSTDQMVKEFHDSTVNLSAMRKEPSISDLQQVANEDATLKASVEGKDSLNMGTHQIEIDCRTIRVGSYRFIPTENVLLSSHALIFKVPHPGNPKEIRTVTIHRDHIVKVLVNFQRILPVIFYYTKRSVGESIREILGMVSGSEIYFDPVSSEEAYKRITILPEYISDEAKFFIKQIYGKPVGMMDELTVKEANNILMKTCPKEVTKVIAQQQSGFMDIKQLLIYPPGKGGLSINTEDYTCLAQDQFLNDVIIDFYIKYLVLHLTAEEQEKVHAFSTFFYKRLTTKPSRQSSRSHPAELDPNLTPAEKRHSRVNKWTKNVNLFDKDFIIVPINESSHWFLAIICFPGMDGCQTFDGKATKQEPKEKKKKTVTAASPNNTIKQIKVEKEKQLSCEDEELSDKDEAECDESDMESEEDIDAQSESSATPPSPSKQPIKQPCILIFDSLACSRRSRVVATLRDYLTVEYKTKMGKEKLYTKDVIKGTYPKVPQQTNFTDCGLYLLQFVESFFKDPVADYHLPIKVLKEWFDEITVTKKREDISNLIKDLMTLYNKDTSSLPEIQFPTVNGKLIIRSPEDEEEEMFDNEEEMEEDEVNDELAGVPELEEDSEKQFNPMKIFNPDEITVCPMKLSSESVRNSGVFVEQSVAVQPDVSELQKTNRDTLSYLKAKRIIRHKSETEIKKFKPN